MVGEGVSKVHDSLVEFDDATVVKLDFRGSSPRLNV